MKVSDRQWQVGDVLTPRDDGHKFWGHRCTVKQSELANGSPVKVACGDTCFWLNSREEVDLEAKASPPTIEQRAVRLAEVYIAATDAAAGSFDRLARSGSRHVSHELAMLLVKRELEAGDG